MKIENSLSGEMFPATHIALESIRQAKTKRVVTAMLNVFGDESSDETGQRTFAVAGIMGTQEEWDALEISWLKRTVGIIFHAADCEAVGETLLAFNMKKIKNYMLTLQSSLLSQI